jgi:aryl sulfotransferase
MPSLTPEERLARDTAMLREVAEAGEWIINSLSSAGFDDIHEAELGIIVALRKGLHPRAVAEVTAQSPRCGRTVRQLTDGLIERGYLEIQENPETFGRMMVAVTRQGFLANSIITRAVRTKRWADFSFRPGDIVIVTPPKNGTTWIQMICALLILQDPELPAPLQELSPWLDWERNAYAGICSQLAAQKHRRFIKSHLDPSEIPNDPRATYIVLARHPLDAALSFYHHELLASETKNTGHGSPRPGRPRPSPREALLRWVDLEIDPVTMNGLEFSLPRLTQHLCDAWARRDEQNFVLLHYADLCADLEGQMRRLASRLGITVPETTWPGLVKAATFEHMRAAAGQLQPLSSLADPAEFFRSGRSGLGRDLLTGAELVHYHDRAARLAPPDLLAWLHRPDGPAADI